MQVTLHEYEKLKLNPIVKLQQCVQHISELPYPRSEEAGVLIHHLPAHPEMSASSKLLGCLLNECIASAVRQTASMMRLVTVYSKESLA